MKSSCRRAIPRSSSRWSKELGPRAHVGTPREAAAFGSVVLVSVPYGAMPQIGADFAAELAGKVIIDTSNPNERRDGAEALEWQRQGAGLATAELLEEQPRRARVQLHSRRVAGRPSEPSAGRIAIPIGGDDAAAIAIAERLIRDAGFDPVMVGTLGGVAPVRSRSAARAGQPQRGGAALANEPIERWAPRAQFAWLS